VQNHDIDLLVRTVNTLFASIPYEIFDQHQEKYFHAVIFLALKLCGFFIQAEVSVATGRVDAVMIHQNRVYIFEFKLNDTAENALQQIKDRGYYKSYESKETYLLGINFSGKAKAVTNWKIEKV